MVLNCRKEPFVCIVNRTCIFPGYLTKDNKRNGYNDSQLPTVVRVQQRHRRSGITKARPIYEDIFRKNKRGHNRKTRHRPVENRRGVS